MIESAKQWIIKYNERISSAMIVFFLVVGLLELLFTGQVETSTFLILGFLVTWRRLDQICVELNKQK